jgi:hypothetical protein
MELTGVLLGWCLACSDSFYNVGFFGHYSQKMALMLVKTVIILTKIFVGY